MGELKAGWRRVKLGEVVQLGNDRCTDPAAEGIERYIGLEHIEPADLRVRSWGDVADGTTFTTRVRPGQVLFGKRRAYQRKVAVADFDAVCSSDIYVFESTDTTRLLPELLPFLCQTDAFFDYAVGTSAGSLSPRTNWASMAEYELALPAHREQAGLVKLLRTANDVYESHHTAASTARTLLRAMVEELLSCGTAGHPTKLVGGVRYPEPWPIVPLGKVADVERGKFSHRPRNLPQFFGDKYPFIQVSDIAASIGTLGPPSQFLSDEGVKYSRSFPPGTVLISITGAILGKTAITDREVWTPDSIVGIQPRGPVAEFLEFVLRRLHPLLNGSLATKSTTQKNINLATLRPLPVPCPSPDIQRAIVTHLQEAQASVSRHEARARAAQRLLASLSERTLTLGMGG